MITREEIEQELDAIHALEFEIETRITEGLKKVRDVNGVELSQENIEGRVKEMANEFVRTCQVKNPMLVTVREGAVPFADLFTNELKRLGFRFQPASISTTSYHGTSSGGLSISPDEKLLCGRRDVFLLEDVIDKGNTYEGLKDLYFSRGVKSIEMIAMIDKKQPRKCEPFLTGFTIGPKEFIAGMGLDVDECLRNIPWVGAVDPTLLPTPDEMARLGRKKHLNEQLRQCIALASQTQSQNSLPQHSFFLDCLTSAGLVGVAALGAMTVNTSRGVGLLATAAALAGLTKVGLFARGISRNAEVVSPTASAASARFSQ